MYHQQKQKIRSI